VSHVVRVRLDRVSYAERLALRDVHFDIAAGEILGVTGPVGAGKTTLALACAGLLGQSVPARIEGEVTHASTVRPFASYVFDDPTAQLTGLGGTVEEEVAVGPENLALPREAIRARVDRALRGAEATAFASRVPDELSGGERQRVALACALALDAPLLVMDEPSAQLDPDATERFGTQLRALAREGRAVLLVSLDESLLRATAHRVLVLERGDARTIGAPDDVLGPDVEPASGTMGTVASANGPPLLDVQDLVTSYDGRTVLAGLTMSAPAGAAVAVLGDNGAGKTTLARAIMGLVPTREGEIRVRGQRIDGAPVHERARHAGLVFQDPSRQLFARSVLDEVMFGPRVLGEEQAVARQRAHDALDVVGLRELAEVHPGDLAPQMQRLVAIAAAMAGRPPLLMLDEPTAGQDREGKERIAAAIRHQRERGCALVITHDLAFARRQCDTAVLLRNGRATSRVLSTGVG
jgi:energy-coupling factor transport system ATP-binding protein